ncbi:nitroreductase family deazaflavin-dependent oxidoreductase [Frankia sp. AiPs1]|uniref:nitroreductase/quinone reductase family protein n=1 Tax=Frankia sp. AiPs1 TaxID=573493 RepID=UPI0020434B1F|nr:nitroreductase/quinone reductase family protein [Frankia sp. AiPs1]MCM3925500.1 nitroreductase family deazaflavin-dependent oxidoreductase [Frankia sp. AiPs1]
MSQKMFTTQEISDFVDEFRANGGRPAGKYTGATLLLLLSGAEADGAPHVSPLNFYADADRYFVYAVNPGVDEDPRWLHDLRADPQATIEVEGRTLRVTATEVHGAKRDEMYARQAARYPQFTELQAAVTRLIPVVELLPTGS